MKSIKYLPLFVLMVAGSCSPSQKNNEIVLVGSGFADSTKLYLMNLETETKDSGYIMNNSLIFTVGSDEPTPFVIHPVFQSRETYSSRYFWKEGFQVSLFAENGTLNNARVEGSSIQLQADQIAAEKALLQNRLDSLRDEYRLVPKEEIEKREAIRSAGNNLEQAILEVDVRFIQNHPDELLSAYSLKNLMKYTIPKEQTQSLFENLSPEMKSSKYGTIVKKFLELSTDFAVGDQIANFKLPDLNGKLIGPDDFAGKYLLLDFWSSNCGPCRMENPNLLRNYKAYQKQGFEILGICLDKNKESWANTVKNDSMIWTTVSDLKSFDGDVPLTYHVYFIPTYYLIDPDGVIIEIIKGRGQLDSSIKKLFEN